MTTNLKFKSIFFHLKVYISSSVKLKIILFLLKSITKSLELIIFDILSGLGNLTIASYIKLTEVVFQYKSYLYKEKSISTISLFPSIL
ncbi:hypothetical protein ACFLY2_01740 [Patescibacteria group bacterium]